MTGFTLAEILTVLVLVGILAAIGFSATGNSKANLSSEVEELKSHLRYAQIRAQADIYSWRLVFTNDRTYQIGPVVIPGQGFTPDIVPGTNATRRILPEGITATSGTAIRFDSWGRPLNDAGFLLFSDQTIALTEGDKTQDLTILTNTGLIR